MFFPEKIKITKSDYVLEIWPGWSPYYRSNILLDRFYDDEEAMRQSWGTWIIKGNKPLIVSKSNRFPFKDKSIDYLICSHVLEHVPTNEIEGFIAEMLRISSRGYIEFPSIYYESFFDIPEHQNILFFKDNVLYVMGKDQFWSFQSRFGYFYQSMRQLLARDIFLWRWIRARKRLFFIWWEYTQQLRVKIITRDEEIPMSIFPENWVSIFSDICNIVYHLFKNKLRRSKAKVDVDPKKFICPECFGDVVLHTNDSVKCSKCEYEARLYR